MTLSKNLLKVLQIFAIIIVMLGHSSLQDVLDVKVQKLMDLTRSKPIIYLNDNKYYEYIESQPRNYSFVVMFTTLDPRRNCKVCSHAEEEFKILAYSSSYASPNENRIFFAIADYDKNVMLFQKLDINSAPVFKHFPANGKPGNTDNLDIQRFGFGSEILSRWIQQQTSIHITIFRPPNYTGTLLLAMLLILSATLLYFKWKSLTKLFSKSFWTFVSTLCIFYMISGQVWNQIRGPPIIQANQQNEIMFIYPSSEYQFVVETFIVMVLYILITGGVMIMHEMPTTVDPGRRKAVGICGFVMFVLFLSILISIFKRKYQSYPYTFLVG